MNVQSERRRQARSMDTDVKMRERTRHEHCLRRSTRTKRQWRRRLLPVHVQDVRDRAASRPRLAQRLGVPLRAATVRAPGARAREAEPRVPLL